MPDKGKHFARDLQVVRKQSHWRGGGRVKAKGSIDANYALYVYQMSMLLAFEYYSFSRNVRRDFLEDFKNAVINVKPDDDYTQERSREVAHSNKPLPLTASL